MPGEKDYEQMYCFFKAGQTLSFVWVCYYGQRTYSSACVWVSTCIDMSTCVLEWKWGTMS